LPNLNRLTRKTHYWVSIAILLPVVVILTTGILLQLKKHWGWVQPPEKRQPALLAQAPSLEELFASVRDQSATGVRSCQDIQRVDIRPDRGIAKFSLKTGYEVQVDLHSRRVLQTAYRRSDLIESLHDGSFFGGDTTKLGIFLPAGIGLLVLSLTGLWLFITPIRSRRKFRRPPSDPPTPDA